MDNFYAVSPTWKILYWFWIFYQVQSDKLLSCLNIDWLFMSSVKACQVLTLVKGREIFYWFQVWLQCFKTWLVYVTIFRAIPCVHCAYIQIQICFMLKNAGGLNLSKLHFSLIFSYRLGFVARIWIDFKSSWGSFKQIASQS